ncbi:MAG: hypothetical protein D6795_13800 [Deltaproteobacteria bacterium]|nr:MAG: hypothetical protein D6795_13800 [Deltaproteobacteria bacterium]
MEGFINESHWDYIEEVYPGLREFYEKLETKPKTFLELFARYQRHLTRQEEEVQCPREKRPEPSRRG